MEEKPEDGGELGFAFRFRGAVHRSEEALRDEGAGEGLGFPRVHREEGFHLRLGRDGPHFPRSDPLLGQLLCAPSNGAPWIDDGRRGFPRGATTAAA